jgi:hypothetical protein
MRILDIGPAEFAGHLTSQVAYVLSLRSLTLLRTMTLCTPNQQLFERQRWQTTTSNSALLNQEA